MTEDEDPWMLKALLAQWPDLERQVAVWPFNGSSSLPTPEVVSGLVKLMGGSLKAVLHRDRDFLMPVEIQELSRSYENAGHILWLTHNSDIEAYWAETEVISKHFGITDAEARTLLADAVLASNDAAIVKRRNKRKDAINKINNKGELPHFNDEDVENEACKNGDQHKVLGKELVTKIREISQMRGYKTDKCFGRNIPDQLETPMAIDLKNLLERAMG